MLKSTLNQLLAGFGLNVGELVVNTVKEVFGREDLSLDVAHGTGDVVEAALQRIGDEVERVLFALVSFRRVGV